MLIAARAMMMIGILAGCYFSIEATSKLHQLKEQNVRLRSIVGHFEVADPSRVYVRAVPTDLELSGAPKFGFWKYRIHFPVGYTPLYCARDGDISTDSPLGGVSGPTYMNSNPRPKASIESLALSLNEHDGKRYFSWVSETASGTTQVKPEIDLTTPGKWKTTFIGQDGAIESFSQDELICLLRVRSKNVDADSGTAKGFFLYMVPKSGRDSFERQTFGMPEPQ